MYRYIYAYIYIYLYAHMACVTLASKTHGVDRVTPSQHPRMTRRPLHGVIHEGRHGRLHWETFLLHGQSTNQCCTIQARPIVHQHEAILH